MKKIWKIVKNLGIAFISLLAILLIFLLIISPGETSAFENKNGDIIDNSVAERGYLEIGGIKQFVLERGLNIDNPVLLVLHGGPGGSEMAMFREYNEELENHFIVVHWDQRGASNSFSEDIPIESMTLDQMAEDTHELTQYLKKKYSKDKIFLLGHSWGSFLGINTANRYPEDYIAYIGTGQISDQFNSEKSGYDFALAKAKELNDTETIEKLNELGQFKDEYSSSQDLMSWVYKQRGFVGKYGGGTYEIDGAKMMLKPLIFCKEYTIGNKLGFLDGSKFSLNILFPPILKIDLSESIPELKIPIYFLQGEHDYVTSYIEAKEYFDNLIAPKKEFITFNKSAHSPPFEEPDRFNKIMIEHILKEN